jgi:alpha-methylacyl-CoA racemase
MGPLRGFKIVEMAGIGPGQLCGMLLADMGAQLIRIDRLSDSGLGITMPTKYNLMNRSRPAIAVDLRQPEGVELVLRLCETADALFEGYRPGVMERLGLGPDECISRNKRLVYGRMTGWGQDGPLADAVGHDGNYLGLSGALSTIGEKGGLPVVPLNLVADFGGGALYLAMGMLAAMLETGKSGEGQVVDAAMVDGAASMMTMSYGLRAGGMWNDERGTNLLDGGAPFYRTYATKDEKSVVVCALESKFFRALLAALGLDEINPREQFDSAKWPQHAKIFEDLFRTRSRDEWRDILEGTDACFAPVLSLTEAPQHPHNEARKTFVKVDGIQQPGPAPRFSRTRSEIRHAPTESGERFHETLSDWGLSESDVSDLIDRGIVGGQATRL